MKYLAMDIGSSFLKYTVLDLSGKRIGLINKIPMPKPDIHSLTRYEISPEKIWMIVRQLIHQISEEEVISGIVFSTQMHGFLLENDQNECITSYITWQDNRCLEIINGQSWLDRLKTMNLQELMSNAGVKLTSNISLCNLYTVVQENELAEENIHFFTLGSWLIRNMTGNNICHITNGACTGLVDIINGRWNYPLIRKLGYQNICFPELERGIKHCGFFKIAGREIPVYPDFGDHQMCVLGCGVEPEEDVNINIGTAGLLGIISHDYRPENVEVRPYFKGMYLNTKRGLPGGRDLGVIADFFKDIVENISGRIMDDSEIWKVISTCPQKKEIYFYDKDKLNKSILNKKLKVKTNFYEGGEITGITQRNFSFQTLMNSIYTEMAIEYQNALNNVSSMKKVKHIVYSGGVTRENQWLKEKISEQLGYDIREVSRGDEAIQGLFRMSLFCCKS